MIETGAHDSDVGQWQTVQCAADPRLRPYVHGYFASSSRLRVAVRERHLPSAEVPLLLNFGEAHRRRVSASALADSDDWIAHDRAWIVGLHTRHQLTRATGERHFMVVRFTPIGAHVFLGVPMHSIANDAIDLDAVDARLARAVVDRVGRVQTWPARFAAMEALIAERIATHPRTAAVDTVTSSAAHVWRRLVATDGDVALGALADQLDCSRRTLIARFRACVGFPPKTIARLLRFNHVLRELDRASRTRANETVGKPYIERADDPDGASSVRAHARDPRAGAVRWADVATDCGYFDQAHLIRDFREFAGDTPEAFLRRVFDAI